MKVPEERVKMMSSRFDEIKGHGGVYFLSPVDRLALGKLETGCI